MLLCSLPGRQRPSGPDCEVLPGCSAKHAALVGTARSPGSLVSPHAEEGSGRNQRSETRLSIHGWAKAANNRNSPVTNSRCLGPLFTSGEAADLNSGKFGLLRIFRLGELLVETVGQYDRAVHLSWEDVVVDNRTSPSMVRVHLKRSKCDRSGGELMSSRDIQAHASAPWRQQWHTLYFDRIGQGHSSSTIQALGRWQSSAFLQYIRMSQEQLATISRRLALAAAGSHTPGQAS